MRNKFGDVAYVMRDKDKEVNRSAGKARVAPLFRCSNLICPLLFPLVTFHYSHSEGTARAISTFIDPALCWDDITWFKQITKMPIFLKGSNFLKLFVLVARFILWGLLGVQCAEDVILAVEYGCQGVVLSNHGGRQLDTARSGVEILQEVMRALRKRGWEKKLEVSLPMVLERKFFVVFFYFAQCSWRYFRCM